MKALVIREPWIDLILDGRKTWEMRTTSTAIRGRIGLIRKGSGLVCGTVELVDSLPPLSRAELAATQRRHGIPPADQADTAAGGWVVPWVFRAPHRLARPVPYDHPAGAVIWVNLPPDLARRIRAEEAGAPAAGATARPQPAERPGPRAGTGAATTANAVLIPLTAGNLRNSHIYLRRAAHLLPAAAIGGAARSEAAPRQLSVHFEPGSRVTTDIAGDKMILRERAAVRDFLARAGARPGDAVLVERTAPFTLHVSLRKATA